MKRAICYVVNGSSPLFFEQGGFRSEGRYAIHYGMGLTHLGYDVDIMHAPWNIPRRQVYKTAHITSIPYQDYYDVAFVYSFAQDLNYSGYGKGLLMGISDQDIKDYHKIKDKTTFLVGFKSMLTNPKYNFAKYLPPLFPMPSYSEKFIKCNYQEKDTLIIFINDGVWGEGMKDRTEIRFILDYLSKKYKLKLIVHCKENVSYHPFEAEYIRNIVPYNQLLDKISEADIAILPGVEGGCAMQWDVISLGKPVLTFKCEKDVFECSPISNENIYIDIFSSNEKKRDTIDRLMKDPVDLCERMQELGREIELKNWIEIMKEILE